MPKEEIVPQMPAEKVIHLLRYDLAEIAGSKGKITPADIRKYANYLYKQIVEWEKAHTNQ